MRKCGNPEEIYRLGRAEKSLTAWAKEYGMNPSTVRKRVKERGWGLAEALTIPVGVKRDERKCDHCIYGTKYGGNWGCQYILLKHRMRKSPVGNCKKYVKGIPQTKQGPMRIVI